jgi:hypothetical protein
LIQSLLARSVSIRAFLPHVDRALSLCGRAIQIILFFFDPYHSYQPCGKRVHCLLWTQHSVLNCSPQWYFRLHQLPDREGSKVYP